MLKTRTPKTPKSEFNFKPNFAINNLKKQIKTLELRQDYLETDAAFVSVIKGAKNIPQTLKTSITPKASTPKTPATPKATTPKTGITGSEMVNLLKDNSGNPETLATLFTTHEDLFIKSVQNIRDELKVMVLPTITAKYPKAAIEKLNAKVKFVNLHNEGI